MFTKILLIKEDIKNIFNILNKIIMHIFLLFIDIEFVILSIEVKTSFFNDTICKFTKIF